MSVDKLRRPRSVSPPASSSGRDSPLPSSARLSRRAQADQDDSRRPDKNYRKYAAAIERALAAFDAGRLEWPDYISSLGRLLKAIQAHPPGTDSLPHRTAVALRLSQCLNPSLPSGVHQKALEVYAYVFGLLARDRLGNDLAVYLPGLSPVLSFASLSLHPSFLSLIETHILPLGSAALRPALKALILTLLPGLEDESSEEFDRALRIVDGLRQASSSTPAATDNRIEGLGDEFFWQCLFLACISSRSRRQGALTYLARRLPRLLPDGDGDLPMAAESVISPEPGLLVRCFIVGLQDDQLLIQRGFLDLLLTHLPLNSPVLTSRVDRQDLERLVSAAISVVARREMSLNRRLWLWFLGPQTADDDDDNSAQVSSPVSELPNQAQRPGALYFEQFGLQPLTQSVLAMFVGDRKSPALMARPYRICLSLLDRSEIGDRLIGRVFVPAMRAAMRFQQHAPESDAAEVLRSANSFFDGIESGVIWAQMLGLVLKAFEDVDSLSSQSLDSAGLVKFILASFNVKEEEMVTFHIPLVALVLLGLVNEQQQANGATIKSRHRGLFADEMLSAAEKMVAYLPERAKLNDSFAESDGTRASGSLVRSKIKAFYSERSGNIVTSPPPFSSHHTAGLLLAECATVVCSGLQEQAASINVRAKIFTGLLAKIPNHEGLEPQTVVKASSAALSLTQDRLPFPILTSTVQILNGLSSARALDEKTPGLGDLLPRLVAQAWAYLTPSYPRHHVEAVRLLWQLDDLARRARLVEAVVSESLTQTKPVHTDETEMARRFAVIWVHTAQATPARKTSTWSVRSGVTPADGDWQQFLFRPLCLILDGLDEHDTELKFFLCSWLTSLSNIDIVLDMLLRSIVQLSSDPLAGRNGEAAASLQSRHHDTTNQCLYFLRHLLNVVKLSSANVWSALGRPANAALDDGEASDRNLTLDHYVARLCLRLLRSRPITPDSKPSPEDVALQCTSLSLLQRLIQSPNPQALQNMDLDISLIDTMREYLSHGTHESALQIALLDSILAALKIRKPSQRVPASPLSSPLASTADVSRTLQQQQQQQPDISALSLHIPSQPPRQLVDCLQEGISVATSYYVLEHWIRFLINVLPMFAASIFQNLIPLVGCICKQITSNFDQLRTVFLEGSSISRAPPEPALNALMSGLEHILAIGHEQLALDETKNQAIKSPEPAQGFFGNVVSGFSAAGTQPAARTTANTRLTVVLCFQDAVKICLSVWSWGSLKDDGVVRAPHTSGSFSYNSLRLRNKARRILDRLFAVEVLECLETVVATWSSAKSAEIGHSNLKLLHVLDATQPKAVMPAIFNSIYSRTNPGAIDSVKASTLTSDLTVAQLGHFLVDYTQSLDDDAMDEIWADCMTFLRDVLSNPLPHSAVLPFLLFFLVTLADKIDGTNFGEQRKIRKELSDYFLRVLSATLTTRNAICLPADAKAPQLSGPLRSRSKSSQDRPDLKTMDYIDIFALVLPSMPTILVDSDKLITACANISAHSIAPVIAARAFPETLREPHLTLLSRIARLPGNPAAKVWKRDVGDIFYHAKFTSLPRSLAQDVFVPLVTAWAAGSEAKDRLLDLLSRISAPTGAGIMFGVGATAARLDADKKTQANLRRIALLILACPTDTLVPQLQDIEECVTSLLTATPSSSPSSMTRADVFIVLQALVLRTSSIHLASFWPLLTAELQRAIASALSRSPDFETYNVPSLLQACRLLDLLLVLRLDDFQLTEWLFVADTVDAVYRPADYEAVGLVDDLAEEMTGGAVQVTSPIGRSPMLNSTSNGFGAAGGAPTNSAANFGGDPANVRTGLLAVPPGLDISRTPKDQFVLTVLQPWCARLSIHAYEQGYALAGIDHAAHEAEVLGDVFDDGTIVG